MAFRRGVDELSASYLAFDTSSTDTFLSLKCTCIDTHSDGLRRKGTQQLSSHLPIRPRTLADSDPSVPLCLNCSPTACGNEKLSVYGGYALACVCSFQSLFSSPWLQRQQKQREFNDAVEHVWRKRNGSYKDAGSPRANECSFKKKRRVNVCEGLCENIFFHFPSLMCAAVIALSFMYMFCLLYIFSQKPCETVTILSLTHTEEWSGLSIDYLPYN